MSKSDQKAAVVTKVLDVLRGNESPTDIRELKQQVGAEDFAVRDAVWQLIDEDRVSLTPDLCLEVPD